MYTYIQFWKIIKVSKEKFQKENKKHCQNQIRF